MSVRNILFIMCDQLRADYLGCYGNSTVRTPHIDSLARSGTTFTRAYAQSPTCGPSRMSFYTGRYAISHGATWNEVPLSICNETIGDLLADADIRVALVGKTHMCPDRRGLGRVLDRHGVSHDAFLKQWGFEQYHRDDGLHPTRIVDPDYVYNSYLKKLGYDAENPWETFANSAAGPDGSVLSGWRLRHSSLPARIDEAHSETAFTTDKAIEFITEQGEAPWLLHLSYIKPHWPYMAPAPYHDMYGPDDIAPAVRSHAERNAAHPVVAAYRDHRESLAFSRDEVRRTVIPAYMGLVSQIDAHLGRLFEVLRDQGRMNDTLIVFTSDHGDYLGDHWLGEKELFYEAAARIPLIVRTPTQDASSDSICDAPVEAIDLVPTFLDALGQPVPDMVLEGTSLIPLISGSSSANRNDLAFSELDYTFRPAREAMGLDLTSARAFMVRNRRWKYVHYHGARPQLFDLYDDPDELVDLGHDPGYSGVRLEMQDRLLEWFSLRKARTTLTREQTEAMMDVADKFGMLIGVW